MKREYLKNGLIAALAFVCVGARVVPGAKKPGPVYKAATSLVTIPRIDSIVTAAVTPPSAAANPLAAKTAAAVQTLASVVRPLSHPKALETAFKSYFAYTTAHPDEVKKPFLYFVDYGLPSTEPRGYVFDMSSLSVVEGPFTVAHGRGSSTSQYGVPTRFSNAPGSAMTSLGLYLAEGLYQFVGHTSGHTYSSVGLRLEGVTPGYNDHALARGVVAHGAPYVSATKAGRSEGCPAMEPQRAQRVLPELANGGMVFLFAPEADLLASASDE